MIDRLGYSGLRNIKHRQTASDQERAFLAEVELVNIDSFRDEDQLHTPQRQRNHVIIHLSEIIVEAAEKLLVAIDVQRMQFVGDAP